MKQLIYASIAKEGLKFDDIQTLLTCAVNNNKENNISGMMVYNEFYFLQCIEGEEEIIDSLYRKISDDIRHSNLKLLGTQNIVKRNFEEWSLGYVNDSSVIKKVIQDECGLREFKVFDFEYIQARNILEKLSFLI